MVLRVSIITVRDPSGFSSTPRRFMAPSPSENLSDSSRVSNHEHQINVFYNNRTSHTVNRLVNHLVRQSKSPEEGRVMHKTG